jgi:hypothetical protein
MLFVAENHPCLQRSSGVDNLLILMPDPAAQSQHSITILNPDSSRHGGFFQFSLAVLTSFFHLSPPRYQHLDFVSNPFNKTT